jgi:festuclavine dehydrogenase
MAKSTILLTGGTGKVSRRIAPLLSASGHAILIASRSGNTPSVQLYEGVKFDWFDSTTFHQPFEYGPISAIFLVAPPIMYCLPPMKEFIELAIQKGTKRFVLLSGSLVDSGDGPMMAQVSNYLAHLNVEYAILQPTWFMENFSEMEHLQTIRDRDTIVTATGEGKVPFVSVDDIAAVAVRALTDEVSHNTEHLILGQDLWSYDDVGSPSMVQD